MSIIRAVSFTSQTAEFNAVRTGSVDVGYIPPSELPEVGAVEARGYHVFGYPSFGFNYVVYNFLDKTGHFDAIIAQRYIRQAIAHLENEAGYIRTIFGGAAGPAYGPVPALPASPYAPANAVTNPYPFSVDAAVSLLTSHGWTVHPGGTDVCTKAGSGPGECGAGIPAGTKLAFNLVLTADQAIERMDDDLASQAAKAGITISLKHSTFNYIITNYNNQIPGDQANVDKWAMADFGGQSISTYPTQLGVFDTAGGSNSGSYHNPIVDHLINASVTSGDPAAVRAEAAFLTADQPGLFQPNQDKMVVWKTNLSGAPASFANLTQLSLTLEFWYFAG